MCSAPETICPFKTIYSELPENPIFAPVTEQAFKRPWDHFALFQSVKCEVKKKKKQRKKKRKVRLKETETANEYLLQSWCRIFSPSCCAFCGFVQMWPIHHSELKTREWQRDQKCFCSALILAAMGGIFMGPQVLEAPFECNCAAPEMNVIVIVSYLMSLLWKMKTQEKAAQACRAVRVRLEQGYVCSCVSVCVCVCE